MFLSATMAPPSRPGKSGNDGRSTTHATPRRLLVARYRWRILTGVMVASDAILDNERGMKQISCSVASECRSERQDSPHESPGIIPAGAKKFPRHILVVDDEPLIRWSIAESLS